MNVAVEFALSGYIVSLIDFSISLRSRASEDTLDKNRGIGLDRIFIGLNRKAQPLCSSGFSLYVLQASFLVYLC